MKKTISIIIAAVMGATLVTSAFAQGAGPAGGQKGGQKQGGPGGPGGPGGRQGGPGGGMRRNPMQMDEPILAKLNLSGDQKKQVKNLKDQMGKKMKELMEKGRAGGGDRSKMREEFRSMMKGYNDGLEKILTAPQQAQYKKEMEAARKKMREQWGNRPGGPGAGGPGAGGPGAGKGKPGKGGKNGG